MKIFYIVCHLLGGLVRYNKRDKKKMSQKNSIRKKVLKLIAIDQLQYNRLRQYGRTPESFNDIVRKLLNEVEERKRTNNVAALEQEAPLSN